VSDADEMRRLMEQSLDWPDPIYIRLAKGGDAVISKEDNGFAIGKAILMRKATAANSVLFITTGVMTTNTLVAAEALAVKGIDSTVLHFHTIKPLDVSALLANTARAKAIVTVEEHSLIGGFGSAVVEALTDNLTTFPPVKRLGLSDAFSKHYGTQNDLFEVNGLMPQQIAETTERFLNRL
jgi:transketolase